MRYEERPPDEKLQPFVKCFWYLERNYAGADSGEVIWPDGCHEMIFHFWRKLPFGKPPLPVPFLIDTFSSYQNLTANGHIRLFGVRFLPWGLKPFIGMKISQLKNQILPLTEIFDSKDVADLEKRLVSASLEEGVHILTKFFHSQLSNAEKTLTCLLSAFYPNCIKIH